MRAFPPTPFHGKEVTMVRKPCLLRTNNTAPPWGGPAESR